MGEIGFLPPVRFIGQQLFRVGQQLILVGQQLIY
jgi:hypothetical protein